MAENEKVEKVETEPEPSADDKKADAITGLIKDFIDGEGGMGLGDITSMIESSKEFAQDLNDKMMRISNSLVQTINGQETIVRNQNAIMKDNQRKHNEIMKALKRR